MRYRSEAVLPPQRTGNTAPRLELPDGNMIVCRRL